MKKAVVLFLLLILVASNHNIIFASLEDQEYRKSNINEEMKNRLTEIFEQRIDIWNRFMEGNYNSIAEFEERLKNVITEPLLSIDMDTIKYIAKNPTDYEKVKDFKIKNFKMMKINGNRTVTVVKILWEVEEFEEVTQEEVEYIVEMKKINGKWLLSDYKVKE